MLEGIVAANLIAGKETTVLIFVFKINIKSKVLRFSDFLYIDKIDRRTIYCDIS